MKLYSALFIVVAAFLFSCTNKQGNISAFLNQDRLPAQLFSVDITKDTLLITTNGSIIKLPKGTLQSESNNIKLVIKEALSNTDIVLAGLTTMRGKQALSSGGMIYINAAEGYKVEIKKQVEILIPTKTYNPSMQVFKGMEKDAGKIDWTEPTDLPTDETLKKIDQGEQLFKANCASCHKIDKDFTAPRLAGITERRPKKWLYDFTRNPTAMIAGQINTQPAIDKVVDSTRAEFVPDFYSPCLAQKWKPVIMTAFSELTDNDLDALYAYIKTEGEKFIPPGQNANAGVKDCCDSCEAYGKAMLALYKEYDYLVKKEEPLFTLDREIPIVSQPITTEQPSQTIQPTNEPSTKVSPAYIKATYYTINIKAFGWYNIDMLMKDFSSCEPSELFVRLQGTYETDINIVLVIPSVKAFVEGGKLKDGTLYGFDENDGRIPLPQNAQCYIMAFGEYKDKIVFGKTSFLAGQKQTIEVSLSETTKELMKLQIKQLNLDNVNLEVNNKPAPKPPKDGGFDKKMDAIKILRPMGCDCGLVK